jgi:hypothetical protein
VKKFTMLTSIDNLILTKDFKSNELMPSLTIYPNVDEIDTIIDETQKDMLGSLAYNILKNEGNLVVGILESEKYDDWSIKRVLDLFLIWLRDLYATSWLLYDNCFNSEMAVIFQNVGSVCTGVLCNGLQGINRSNAMEIVNKNLTSNDLLKIVENHEFIMEYLYSKKSMLFSFSLDSQLIRIARALKFIIDARIQNDIALRIFFYTCSLECLFSTSNTELAYKLSERVAFFAFVTLKYKRIEVFRKIMEAHTIKSILTQGDGVPKNEIPSLNILCNFLDEIIRKLINAILKNNELRSLFESSGTKIDEYFDEIIFNAI